MHRWIRLGYGDVIDEGDRFSAHTEKVIDVHGHAIDADPLPALQGRRDLQFASHTVRGKCEQVLAEFDESSESSRQIDRCTDLAGRPDGTEATDEGRDRAPLPIDVHP